MSPILVRPVREQLEHDRVIRLLQAKYRRKFEVAVNPGQERVVPVGTGPAAWYPDLVLQSAERGRRLLGVVEVETTESVNHLEAMSQWAAFSRLRAAFHLYVPASSIDTARRLCADLQISVAEIWAYQTVGDQIRFTLVQRAAAPDEQAPGAGRAPASRARGAHASGGAGPGRAARPGRSVRSPAGVRRTASAKAKSGASGRRSVKTSGRGKAVAGVRAAKRR